jgi:GTP-binding protein HflX
MNKEKIILIGLIGTSDEKEGAEYSISELAELVKTTGGEVVSSFIIKKQSIDPAHIIGSGWLDTIKSEIENKNADAVVFDINNIKAVQYNNLEKYLDVKVLSRCDVILDIFALRASSAEAKIQVELAQLNNMLPRIRGKGMVLSRLGGGIGTRGPGETKLETDRRHIQRKIHKLNESLKAIEKTRSLKRKSRENAVKIAVAGYTNAGKSSLVSLLSKKNLFIENRLFATLDSFTREVFISENKKVLLTDTVGFIRNLPATLVKAFRSTFEEIVFSDMVIHLIDSSNQNYEECIKTVDDELEEIGYTGKVIKVFNKTDLADSELLHKISLEFPDAVFCSVKEKTGIDAVKTTISALF